MIEDKKLVTLLTSNSLIDEETLKIAQTHEIIAFNRDERGISIATTDPTDLQTIEFLKKKLETDLVIHLTTPNSIKEALKQYHQSLEAEFQNISKSEEDVNNQDKDLKELAQDLPVVRIVDTLLEYAIF